ncbi:hypothetical protein [Microcoleus sp. D3_18a_C4]|uniref:hypothetical protein n=1 Tax=Microcoleus sp. D3_18a_C4 TaxID=3055332 RepID=UPI002FD77B98
MAQIEYITGGLSIAAAVLSLWTANNSGLRRLAIVQKKLDASMGLIISLRSRVKDLEKFNAAKNGYQPRSGDSDMDQFFSNSFKETDTGF